jgi:hypothetical protein
MFLTLGDARSKLRKFIGSGACTNADVDARINEVISHLLREGDWKLTIRRVSLWECDSVISLPREFDKVIAVNYDNNPVRVFSKYYEFLEAGPGRIDELANTTASDLVDLGSKYCIMRDIPVNENWKIAAFSTEAEDTDQLITIRGVTSYNNTVLEDGEPYKTIPINRYSNGVEGKIRGSNAIQTSESSYSNIHEVIKPVTKGYVTLYAIDTSKLSEDQDTDPAIYFLAKYHPDETVPSFRRYKIMAANTRITPTSASSGNYIIALVKMALIDAKNANDVLLIQDLPALKLGCLALAKLEADKFDDYKKYKVEAIGLLHRQLMDHEQQGAEINVQMDAFAVGGAANII